MDSKHLPHTCHRSELDTDSRTNIESGKEISQSSETNKIKNYVYEYRDRERIREKDLRDMRDLNSNTLFDFAKRK